MKSIAVVAASMLAVGCATTRSPLSDAAHDLDRTAYDFYDQMREERASRELVRDAEHFAEAARDFNRAVEDRADREEVRDEFQQLRQQFHRMRGELQDGRRLDAEQREEFERLTQIYLDVEEAVSFGRAGYAYEYDDDPDYVDWD